VLQDAVPIALPQPGDQERQDEQHLTRDAHQRPEPDSVVHMSSVLHVQARHKAAFSLPRATARR
jgi:hypothetical protein